MTRSSHAIVHKFCDGSYDVLCRDCHRELCTDQPFDTAERLADAHNAAFHPTIFDQR